jgi:hypothetical protein
MPADETTYLERLHRIERRLFAKLSSIKAKDVECNGIVWVPPGWGMDYWSKGLRFRCGGEAVRYNKLDTDGLARMIANLGDFSEHVRKKYGLDIEPPPKPPGPGIGHWVKMALSPSYKDEVRRSEEIKQITEGREKLQAKRDKAVEACQALETEATGIMARGKETPDAIVRKRLAADVLRLHKKIGRQTSIVRFIDAKLEACEIALHNTEMSELAKIGPVTTAEVMADIQVEAEEAAEDMRDALAAADAVDFDTSSDEEAEAAILAQMADKAKTKAESDSAAAEAEIVRQMETETAVTDEDSAEGAGDDEDTVCGLTKRKAKKRTLNLKEEIPF